MFSAQEHKSYIVYKIVVRITSDSFQGTQVRWMGNVLEEAIGWDIRCVKFVERVEENEFLLTLRNIQPPSISVVVLASRHNIVLHPSD